MNDFTKTSSGSLGHVVENTRGHVSWTAFSCGPRTHGRHARVMLWRIGDEPPCLDLDGVKKLFRALALT